MVNDDDDDDANADVNANANAELLYKENWVEDGSSIRLKSDDVGSVGEGGGKRGDRNLQTGEDHFSL